MDLGPQQLCYRSDLSDSLQVLLYANGAVALLSFIFCLLTLLLPGRRLPAALRRWVVPATSLHVAFLLLGVAVLVATFTSNPDDLARLVFSFDGFLLYPASLVGIPLAFWVRRLAPVEPPLRLFPEPSDSRTGLGAPEPRA